MSSPACSTDPPLAGSQGLRRAHTVPLELTSSRSQCSLFRGKKRWGLHKSSLCLLPFSTICSQQIKLLLSSTALSDLMTVLRELRESDTLVNSISYKTKTKAEKLIYRGKALPNESVLTKSSVRKKVGH